MFFNRKLNLEGVSVSVDISTCDNDARDRLFARVVETMTRQNGELVLLCEYEDINMDTLWHSKSEKPDLERPVVFKNYKHNSKYSCTCTYYGRTKETTKEEIDIRDLRPCDDWAYVDELVNFYNKFKDVTR